MKTKTIPLRKMVISALLLSLILLMSFTPIGFIAIGAIDITLIHLPVLVGLLTEGLLVGLLLGGAFGLVSLLQALTPTTVLAPFFLNPLVSVLPRLLIPVMAWLAYRGAWHLTARWPRQQPVLSYGASALIGTLTNTVAVLGMLYLTAGPKVAEAMGIAPALVGGVMAGIVVSNGIPEAILSVLVVPPLVLAVLRATHRKPGDI